MQSYQSGDWIIHECANCDIDTHVTLSVKGDDKVFVSNKVEVSDVVKVRKPNKYVMCSGSSGMFICDRFCEYPPCLRANFVLFLGI